MDEEDPVIGAEEERETIMAPVLRECGRCQHWAITDMERKAGHCQKTSTHGFMDSKARAVAYDFTTVECVLKTSQDFGCNQWEPKIK